MSSTINNSSLNVKALNLLFDHIDTKLHKASEEKSFGSCTVIAQELLELLKISGEMNKVELLMSSVLQKNDAWTHKAPKYSDRKAYYQLASQNHRNIDFKLFWAKKTNRRTISNLVHRLEPNFEDDELYNYEKYNIGIDFIVPDKADRLIIALSNNYKIRTLELHKTLTNTQKQILEKWYLSPEDSNRKTLHQILWDSFDIHPLNKEFYRNIAELFTLEVQHLVNNKILDEYAAKQFTTRLIGRIIFCWFLRKKNIIAEEFNYFDAKNLSATEFYNKKLEVLFFDILNTPQGNRNSLDRKTPFLNGGLFEARKNDHYREAKISFPNDYFHQFFYDFLDKYNFTTDESSSDFQQVAIDPEMLGRIFENLLAEQSNDTGEQARKAKGAFYTPREIVDYMCRESLRLYLSEKLGDDNRKEKILNLLLDKKEHDFDYKNDRADLNPYKAHLVEALDNLKLLDPACGSGAFPIGMLQIILATYARLDGRLDSYKTKKGIISENIYGVDIEPTAIEISRLRAWLSLIVDIELKASADNSGVEPLPNLDFKFICANSLIPLKVNSQLSLYDDVGFEKSLKFFQEQYFNTKLASEKKKLQVEFKKLLGENVLNSSKNGISERQKQLKTYQPFDSENVCGFFDTHFMFGLDGFDIVIGNPPYLESRHKNFNVHLKNSLPAAVETRWGKKDASLIQRGADLLVYFFELSCYLIRQHGVITFITQNSWLDTDYGKQFQNFLISKTNILGVIDSDFKYFDTANTNTVITLFQGNFVNPNNEMFFRHYHSPFDKEPFKKCSSSLIESKPMFTETVFKQNNSEIKNHKWGVLLSAGDDFISLIKLLKKSGLSLSELPESLKCTIGQGLNLNKSYLITEDIIEKLSLDRSGLLSFFTNQDGAPFLISKTKNFLLDYAPASKSLLEKLENNNLKAYKITESRERPALILPRGVNRYYCAINDCLSFSSSCVEIYTDSKNTSLIYNLWLFLNSSIGWLIREVSGRKNLGGGLLKAEASDLKSFPIYFNFKQDKLIQGLITKLAAREAFTPLKELYSKEHQMIDALVFEHLEIDSRGQEKYIQCLHDKISERMNKSKSSYPQS
jgi:hypothetical protein